MTDDGAATQPAPSTATAAAVLPAEPAPLPAAPAPMPAAPAPTPPETGRKPARALRSLAIGLVFVLTCLSLVLATTTWWVHHTVLDTDAFVSVTAPLAANPAVTDALATVTTNQLDEALDLGPLGPLGRYVVAGISRELYASDAFAAVWTQAMRSVHGQAVAFLKGDTSTIQVVDGMLVINTYPALDRVFDRLRGLDLQVGGTSLVLPTLTNPADPVASRAEMEATLGRPLSPTFGVIAIARAAKLEAAQRYVSLFDAFVIVLIGVTALLAVLTLVLARRRVRMAALLAVGAVAALLAARLAVVSIVDGIGSSLADAGPGATIGTRVLDLLAESYRTFDQLILVVALVVAVGVTVAAWLVVRRDAAAGGTEAAAGGWFLAFAGLCLALAALILAGLTLASLVVIALAYAAWLVVLVVRSRRRAAALVIAAG